MCQFIIVVSLFNFQNLLQIVLHFILLLLKYFDCFIFSFLFYPWYLTNNISLCVSVIHQYLLNVSTHFQFSFMYILLPLFYVTCLFIKERGLMYNFFLFYYSSDFYAFSMYLYFFQKCVSSILPAPIHIKVYFIFIL